MERRGVRLPLSESLTPSQAHLARHRTAVRPLLALVRLRDRRGLLWPPERHDDPEPLQVTARRVADAVAQWRRAAADRGGVVGGAASDRAAGAADRADRRTQEGSHVQT